MAARSGAADERRLEPGGDRGMTDRFVAVQVPEVDGVLSASDVLASAATIAAVQRPDGMIPWFEGGHCDPWNHVEAAMALSVCGLDDEADAAFDWLAERQLARRELVQLLPGRRGEGPPARHQRVRVRGHRGVPPVPRHRGPPTTWPGTGRWSRRRSTSCCGWQRPDGSVLWSVDPAGRCESYALLTGSSSIYHALRCAVAIAERLGKERPEWELAAGRLGHAVAHHAGSFAPKDEYAMDWYYPVLAGALPEQAAHHRIVSALGPLRHRGPGRALRRPARTG